MAESEREHLIVWLSEHAARGKSSEFSRMMLVAAIAQILIRVRDTFDDDTVRRHLRQVTMNARRHLALVGTGLSQQELDEDATAVAVALKDANCTGTRHNCIIGGIRALHHAMLFRDDASFRFPLKRCSASAKKLISDKSSDITNDILRTLRRRWQVIQQKNRVSVSTPALSEDTRARIARQLNKEVARGIASDGDREVESTPVGRNSREETKDDGDEETKVATTRGYLEQLTLPQLCRSVEGLSSTRRNTIAGGSIDASDDPTRITEDLVARYLELKKGITLRQALALLKHSPERVRHEVAKALAPIDEAEDVENPMATPPIKSIKTLRDAESIRARFLEQLVFGAKQPTLSSYRKWLAEQPNRTFSTYESKRTVAAAANYFKNKFRVKFHFGPKSATVRLGVSRGSSGTGSFQLFFEPGVEESYVRVAFPELAAK